MREIIKIFTFFFISFVGFTYSSGAVISECESTVKQCLIMKTLNDSANAYRGCDALPKFDKETNLLNNYKTERRKLPTEPDGSYNSSAHELLDAKYVKLLSDNLCKEYEYKLSIVNPCNHMKGIAQAVITNKDNRRETCETDANGEATCMFSGKSVNVSIIAPNYPRRDNKQINYSSRISEVYLFPHGVSNAEECPDEKEVKKQEKIEAGDKKAEEQAKARQKADQEQEIAQINEVIKKFQSAMKYMDDVYVPKELVDKDTIPQMISNYETACSHRQPIVGLSNSKFHMETTNNNNNIIYKCVVETCGDDKHEISKDKKTCVQTAAAKKAEKEQIKADTKTKREADKKQKQDDREKSKTENGIKKVIDKIKSSTDKMKIGESITVATELIAAEDNEVSDAMKTWIDKCKALSDDEKTTKDDVSYSGADSTYTCVITECKPDSGKKLENGICVDKDKTSETVESSEKKHKNGMVCTDAKQHDALATYDENGQCVVKSCVVGYTLTDGNCTKSDGGKQNEDIANAFKQDVDKIIAAFKERAKELTDDCIKNKKGKIEKGQCVVPTTK